MAWELLASGDNTTPPPDLPPGPKRIEVDLPIAVPDAFAGALASAIWTAVAAFVTVTDVQVSGSVIVVEVG